MRLFTARAFLPLLLTLSVAAADTDRAAYTVNRPEKPATRTGWKSWKQAEYVLILSIDGLSFRLLKYYLDNYAIMPHFSDIVSRGFFLPMRTVFPSMTWAAHVAMITGQYPESNGILGNQWIENMSEIRLPYKQMDGSALHEDFTPSLYDLVADSGRIVANLNWPATQGSKNLLYNFPETMNTETLPPRIISAPLKELIHEIYYEALDRDSKWPATSYRKVAKLDPFLADIVQQEKLEIDYLMKDLTVRLVAPVSRSRSWPKKKIPALIMAHFLMIDSLNHTYGTNPLALRWCLQLADQFLGEMVDAYKRAGIFDKTAVFVVSDHGFLNVRYKFDLNFYLQQQGFRKARWLTAESLKSEQVSVILNGQTAFLYFNRKNREADLIRSLRRKPAKTCIEKIYKPAEFSRMGQPIPGKNMPSQHPGAPDLMVVSKPYCTFVLGYNQVLEKIEQKAYKQLGSHGYLPDHPELISFFSGAGAGIRHATDRTQMLSVTDVAPTVAQVMGVKWPQTFRGREFRMQGKIAEKAVLK